MWVTQYLQYPFPAGLKIIEYNKQLRAIFDKVPPPPPNHFKGKGGNIGPNLDAYQLNNPGFIVPAVVDPNLGIHEEYAGFNVVTKDNQRLTGFIAQNAPRFIVLRDLSQNNITLARDEIKELKQCKYQRCQKESLMA